MKNISFLLAALVLGMGYSFSQKIKVVQGDFSALKGQQQVNIEYKYDDLKVGKMTEAEYVDKKYTEYEEKEPGKGDKFKASWESDPEKRYHPKFEELINDVAKKIHFGDHPNAQYKMIVNVSYIDPGWNVGISKKPAYMDSNIKLVDSEGKVLCEVTVERAPGSQFGGYDYDSGTRVAECFAITGKRLGAMVVKDAK